MLNVHPNDMWDRLYPDVPHDDRVKGPTIFPQRPKVAQERLVPRVGEDAIRSKERIQLQTEPGMLWRLETRRHYAPTRGKISLPGRVTVTRQAHNLKLLVQFQPPQPIYCSHKPRDAEGPHKSCFERSYVGLNSRGLHPVFTYRRGSLVDRSAWDRD